jgi:diaminopimelate epimerase
VSRRLRFEKWEGLGNDFIVVAAEASLDLDVAAVQRICDRRRGVGGDGVLVVDRPRGSLPRMVVRNADGSRPEMCGNGLRCVAAWLLPQGGELTVETDAGERRCAVESSPAGFQVSVGMGAARFGEVLEIEVAGQRHRFATVDVGNPHAVTFEEHEEVAIERIGPVVAALPPSGYNVEFCRVTGGAAHPDRIDVIVWERGVGRTLACGTGACAVAAEACRAGRARWGEAITVGLPGGDLSIVVQEGARAISMRGPARRTFTGELELP